MEQKINGKPYGLNPPVLITGTPRSGTKSVADNFNLGHEIDNPRGTVDFKRVAQAIAPERFGFNQACQLVRDPGATIASLADLCHPNNGHWQFMEQLELPTPEIGRSIRVRDQISAKMNPIANAATYWYVIHGWLHYYVECQFIQLERLSIFDPKRIPRNGRVTPRDIHENGGYMLAAGVKSLSETLGYRFDE